MIIDPINLTSILAAIAWPFFGWLAVRAICKAVNREGDQRIEHLKVVQQHEEIQNLNKETKE